MQSGSVTHHPSLNLCLETVIVSQGGHFSDEKSFRNRFNDTFLFFSFLFLLLLLLTGLIFYNQRTNDRQNLFISSGSLFVVPPPSMLPRLSPPQDGDTVISAIIYLLMQTRPCPRCAGRLNIHIVVTGRPLKDEIGGM